jgi:hypothetical protein
MKQKSHQSAYATKIKKLVETAKQLRTENFRLALPITRLTSFNCLCQDEVAAQQFALYMSKRVQQQINDADCASHLNPEEWEQNKILIANAITQMEHYLETPSPDGKQSLCQLLKQIDELQGDDYRNVSWATVRFVKSGELLKLEYAIRCFVDQDFPYYAYRLAREFIEGYKPQYGTGLIPESVPMLLEVAEFLCQYYFGQNLSQKFPNLIYST